MRDNSMMRGMSQNPNPGNNNLDEKQTKRVIGGVIREGESVFVRTRKSILTPDNRIREEVLEEMKYFSCGCPCHAIQDIGRRCDRCETINCREHSFRCVRCNRSICVRCAKPDSGYILCGRCFWILFFAPWRKVKYFR
jgi:hypothetical protein